MIETDTSEPQAKRPRRMNAREVSLTGVPGIGRATVIGALLGAVCVGVPLAIALVGFGGGPTSIIAGAHVGFFGGMGFGGMLGAVIQADRSDRQRRSGTWR